MYKDILKFYIYRSKPIKPYLRCDVMGWSEMARRQDQNMERLSATMPKDVLDRLRELSYRERRPLSAQLTLIVEKYLKELEANAN